MRLLKTRRQKVDHVEFNTAGGLLAVGPVEAVCWKSPTLEAEPDRIGVEPVFSATFVRGGELVAVSDAKGVSLMWTGSVGRRLTRTPAAHVVWSPHGTLALYRNLQPLRGFEAMATPLRPPWSVGGRRCFSPPAVLPACGHLLQFENRIRPVRLSSRTPYRPYWLVVRDSASGEVVREWQVRADANGKMAASPDDRWLAVVIAKGIPVFDLAGARPDPVHRILSGDRHQFTSLVFHPSGRYLAATSNDATVRLYDTSNWSLATTYTWDVGRMRSVAFSPDGLLAAAGSDTGKVVVWDVDV